MSDDTGNAVRILLKKIKARMRDAYWEMYGSTLALPRPVDRPRTMLFLCQGNICRSPFAERFARHLDRQTCMAFLSAGIDVSAANPAPAAALEAARQFGIEMADHRSQPLTMEMMQACDAIFVMEVRQRIQLKRQYPFAAGKIHPLALFQDQDTARAEGYEKYNIQDPFGRSVDEFVHCYRRISNCIQGFLQAAD